MKTLLAIVDADLKRMLFPESVLDKLRAITEIEWWDAAGQSFDSAGLSRIIGGYDACLTSWGSPFFTDEALASASKLSYIGHAAGSATAVVNENAFVKGIAVVTANKMLAKSTAEAAVALMMAGAWNLQGYSRRLQSGGWSYNNGETVPGLSGRTIGLIGLGEISRNVIALLKGFPVDIKLSSRFCTEEEAKALGVRLCSLEEVLSTSSIVSLHSSLTPSTVGMIGARELALIPDDALFVNTARARIVDESALMNELKTGRFHAALDVYHQEPLPADHPLLQMEHVLCVPHIGGFAGKYKTALADFVIDGLAQFLQEQTPDGQVTLEDFGRMTANALA